jgi:hypothetical protein
VVFEKSRLEWFMMPQSQQDYFARALAYRVINETRRMQEDLQRLAWDHEPRMLEERLRAWEEEIHRACHEMNQAPADTITRLQEEVGRLYSMIPPSKTWNGLPPLDLGSKLHDQWAAASPSTVEPVKTAPLEVAEGMANDGLPHVDSISEPMSIVEDDIPF